MGEIERKSDGSRLADYEGCYYLSNIKDSNAMDCNKSGVTNCTYASLSGGDAFTALQNTGFSTVTTETTNEEPLNGRYSFANDLSLLGTDYPFPTILTQSSDVAPDGVANVHYGDWPIEGIRREEGALPVNLDLFANYDPETQGAVRTETLTLSAGLTGGTWTAESADTKIAAANIDQTGKLTITAQSAGSTVVTVTYGTCTPLEIEVNVTAQLRLTTVGNTAVTAFTDATVSVPLQLTAQNGGALPESLLEKITVSDLSVEFDPDYFTTASLTDPDKSLYLTAGGKTTPGTTQMTAAYTFTYLGTTYHATSVLSLHVVEPVIVVAPVTFIFDGGEELATEYTGKEQGQFILKLLEDGEAQTLEQLHLTAYEEVAAEFKDVAWVQWAKRDDGTEEEGTLSITAYSQPLYPAAVSVRVQYQFQYGGSTHTLWLDLPIELKEPQPEEPVTPPEESTEEEVPQP